jgi:hypothetical protein
MSLAQHQRVLYDQAHTRPSLTLRGFPKHHVISVRIFLLSIMSQYFEVYLLNDYQRTPSHYALEKPTQLVWLLDRVKYILNVFKATNMELCK